MVKTWPFERLLVPSNDQGSKGRGLPGILGFKWKLGETTISYSYIEMWSRLIETISYIINIDVSRSEQQTDAFLVRWTGKNPILPIFFEIPQVFPGICLGEWWESCLDLNLVHLVGD